MPEDMRENKVWSHFSAAWPYYSDRSEPGMGDVDAGRPDTMILDRRGVAGLVELKAPSRAKLRLKQWIWHERFQQSKGKGVVVTCFNHHGKILWRVWAINAVERELSLLSKHWNQMAKMEISSCNRDVMINLVARHLRLEI